jgi:hypothetical protein
MQSKLIVLIFLILSQAASAISTVEAAPAPDSATCNADETLLVGNGHSALRCRQGGAAEAEDLAMNDLQNNAFCDFAGKCDGDATLRTDLPSDGSWHFGIIGCDAQQYGCAKCTPKAQAPKAGVHESIAE